MSTVLSNGAGRRRKFNLQQFARMKAEGEPIVMVTAYDSTSAKLAEVSGVEVILVGDSVAMVCLGHQNTLPVTLEEMLHHAKAVSRGARTPFLIGDLPFLSYHGTPEDAVLAAGRFLKEAGMDAVKLEGGTERVPAIEAMVKSGIPVMGHLGLTPQKIHQLGGFKPQATTAEAARTLLLEAKRLEEAGIFSLVLESVPAEVAEVVTNALTIPTIGIGAGVNCDGQVLVWHDLLGLDEDFCPPFAKSYRQLGRAIVEGLQEYRAEVKDRSFPAAAQTRQMAPTELLEFENRVKAC
ncbi:MAG: 3-methyl-2-oxobutanoate hydroxymethyltransferase [Candidatus Eremiobacteraeota bacterium]|nr:3-methyl-2-oxobutanoate hydroxymethyltransferase [Candidatus Eremiobacteraeota bacterium]